MTPLYVLVILTIAPFFVVALALFLKEKGQPEWVMRKLLHVTSIMTVSLYVTLMKFEEAMEIVVVFFTVLVILSFTRLRVLQEIFEMSTREGETTNWLVLNNILTTITLTVLYFVVKPYPWIFLTSALAVSFGDGLGELIGRPYGRHKYHILGQKSIEGSLGVFIGTFFGGLLSFFLLSSFTSWILIVLLIVSVVVMLIEAFSVHFMDNIIIPIATATMMYFLLV